MGITGYPCYEYFRQKSYPDILYAGVTGPFVYALFVLEFSGPVNNEFMSSWPVNSGTVPGQA